MTVCHCVKVQPNETPRNGASRNGARLSHRRGIYQKVLDARKRPIRGLWRRNTRFYARLAVEDTDTGIKMTRRVPLEGALTVAQAQDQLKELQVDRRRKDLPVLKRTPKFRDCVRTYVDYFKKVKDAKRASTLAREKGSLKLWSKHFGDTRLDRINRVMINAFIAKRQAAGISGRTVNIDVIALRSLLKRAVEEKWIKSLPTENMRPLKWISRRRELVPWTGIEAVCAASLQASKNGQQLCDYVKLMAFCGARRNETLRLKWSDVDWNRRQLSIGTDGLSKNRKARVVDFNEQLEAHLKSMDARKVPDSEFVFPSPQRGNRDASTKTFTESLKLARVKLKEQGKGPANFSFHDCRHFFISMAVMSGIDYLTIARWVGHQDGGVLIGKVYGHLTDGHSKQQADKLVLTPQPAGKTGTRKATKPKTGRK